MGRVDESKLTLVEEVLLSVDEGVPLAVLLLAGSQPAKVVDGVEGMVEVSVDGLINEAVSEEENRDADVLVLVKGDNPVVGVLEFSVVVFIECELYLEESLPLFVSILEIIATVEAFGGIEGLITLKCTP